MRTSRRSTMVSLVGRFGEMHGRESRTKRYVYAQEELAFCRPRTSMAVGAAVIFGIYLAINYKFSGTEVRPGTSTELFENRVGRVNKHV